MPTLDFVRVEGTRFKVDKRPYYITGANFWQGANLGSRGEGGDREGLVRELDHLESMGINNLRIMGGTEGPDNKPGRIAPSMQPELEKYNEYVLDGLDFLIDEMAKRSMKAVVCLNNSWQWSGGMSQYLEWTGIYPTAYSKVKKKFDEFLIYITQFYYKTEAMAAFRNHIEKIVTRINHYSNRKYCDDPTIMAWELANEPRGVNGHKAYLEWVSKTAEFIRSLDPNHLVTVGSEGNVKDSGNNFILDHSSEFISYGTVHVWVQNMGWYNPQRHDETYPDAGKRALNFLKDHVKMAKKLGKPLVLEEFGFPRDGGSCDPNAPTTRRDMFYRRIFQEVCDNIRERSPLSGSNFWVCGSNGGSFTGDPPHEPPGLYSVYNTDSTIEVISKFAEKVRNICN